MCVFTKEEVQAKKLTWILVVKESKPASPVIEKSQTSTLVLWTIFNLGDQE